MGRIFCGGVQNMVSTRTVELKQRTEAEIEKERALRLLQIIHDLALILYPYKAQQESPAVPLAAFNLGRIAGIAKETIKHIEDGRD